MTERDSDVVVSQALTVHAEEEQHALTVGAGHQRIRPGGAHKNTKPDGFFIVKEQLQVVTAVLSYS